MRDTEERLLTPEEAAERLAVTPRTLREWLRRGTLRGVRVGGKLLRVPETALADVIAPVHEDTGPREQAPRRRQEREAMADSAERQRRARERRRQTGAKPYELWLTPEAQGQVDALRLPDERLDALLLRGLEALNGVTRDATSDTSPVTSAVPGDVTSDMAEELRAVLLAFLKALFPEGKAVYPRPRYGLTVFPLALINDFLDRHGYVLTARKVRKAEQFVSCLDRDGREVPYGLFELRRVEEGER